MHVLTLWNARGFRECAAKDKFGIVHAGTGRMKWCVACAATFQTHEPLSNRKGRDAHKVVTQKSATGPSDFNMGEMGPARYSLNTNQENER